MNYVFETEAPVQLDLGFLIEDIANSFAEPDLLVFVEHLLDSVGNVNFAERVSRRVNGWISEYGD